VKPTALLAVGLLAAAGAQAHTEIFTATLRGTNENPVNASTGIGGAVVTLDLDLATLHVAASFADLTGTTTASHIHCCSTAPTNAGVATQTPTFAGFPLGVTSGIYEMTFDMTQASSYNPAFIVANGNTVGGAFNALVAGMEAGRSYLNIHTTTFGGGEIRGFLQPVVAAVPEPGTYAMLLAGLAVVGGVARRRRS
jgi:hypothetical protein